jgi:hypothetical protein
MTRLQQFHRSFIRGRRTEVKHHDLFHRCRMHGAAALGDGTTGGGQSPGIVRSRLGHLGINKNN